MKIVHEKVCLIINGEMYTVSRCEDVQKFCQLILFYFINNNIEFEEIELTKSSEFINFRVFVVF